MTKSIVFFITMIICSSSFADSKIDKTLKEINPILTDKEYSFTQVLDNFRTTDEYYNSISILNAKKIVQKNVVGPFL
ncbi:MAG: hypothetical protein HQK76_07555 [Desulfobacterales bacterium]|nr:hypothetical protein [Desulfobacterales bacterium]